MSQSTKESKKLTSFRRLLSLIAEQRSLLLWSFVALALGVATNLTFPQIIRHILNENLRQYYFSDHAARTVIFVVVLFLFQALCFYFRSLLFGVMGQRIVNTLRSKVFNKLIHQDISFFDQAKTGDLVSGLASDTVMIQDIISVRLSVFVRYSIQVLGGLALMFYTSTLLTGLLILCVPLIVFVSRTLGKKLKFWSSEQQRYLGLSSALANESFTNARIVKAFNQEEFEAARYASNIKNVLTAGIERMKVSAFFSSFVSFLVNATLVVILFYGSQLVLKQQLAVGDWFAFILYGVIVAVSFAFVVSSYSEFIQGLGAAERVFGYLDLFSDSSLNGKAKGDIIDQGDIVFSDVSFAYPSRPDTPVLQDVSFTLEKGKVTAIVGPSGAGKSTIVNLLMKFYHPSKGKILISGTDAELIDARLLRSTIAFVPQDPQLFALSIEENLRYAKPEATLEEIEGACKSANILDFIKDLPQQFKTEVGERGVQLSGGQKQRISIARALLRNPQILILDEATSSLDSENEFLVKQALDILMVGRTTLVIAHRLATVKNADKVIVLQGGQIVQSGDHEELLSQGGLYRQLVERQELIANV